MTNVLRRPDGRVRAGWRFGSFLLALALGGALLAGLFFLVRLPKQMDKGVLQPLPLLWTGLAVLTVVVGITWLFLRFVEHRSFATIGLPGNSGWRSGIPVGLLLGAVVPIGVAGFLWASGHAKIEMASLSMFELLRTTLPMVVATLTLSSWEEVAWRGYPLQLLNEASGPWVGTALAGIGFGLVHSRNPGAEPVGLALTALNGLLLGWVVLRTGSLWLACGYHAGWNVAASELLGMRDSGVTAPGSLFTTTLSGPGWLAGGAYGFESSALTGLAETALLGALIVYASRLPGVAVARPYFVGSG